MATFMSRLVHEAERVNYAEYIQSSGTQWIDTLFKPNQNTKIVCDAQFTATPQIANALFGARTVASTNSFYWFYHTSLACFLAGYGAETSYQWKLSDTLGRKTVTIDKNVVSVDGSYRTYTYTNFQSECNLVLFAMNEENSIMFHSTARLYSCQIYDNGTLIRDFWPCYDSDGAACLYDKVDGKYYYNAGTGEFIAGGAA